ncbi:hypothetical protein ACQKFK_29960 [Bacillus mycoides]|uniref:hypothetical protein n=1 Tax=Bacillus mycoides TaxID=1405 RepID=UPI003CFFF2C8
MLKKQEILAVYQKGHQAICDFVHQLESQIQNLKERIEELENRSKKTLQIGFWCEKIKNLKMIF